MSVRLDRNIVIRHMARSGVSRKRIAAEFQLSAKSVSNIAAGAKAGTAARSKYSNEKTDGFASKREAKRAQDLQLLERAGKISNLKFQVRFEIIPAQDGERPAYYIADFVYDENDVRVVEDCKGYRTDVFRLKRKLMLWKWGIKVRET